MVVRTAVLSAFRTRISPFSQGEFSWRKTIRIAPLLRRVNRLAKLPDRQACPPIVVDALADHLACGAGVVRHDVGGRFGAWPMAAKRAKSKLLDAMAARSPTDEDEKPARGKMISGDLSPLTANEVHKIIGREPSQTVTKPAKMGANEEISRPTTFRACSANTPLHAATINKSVAPR